ncbi:synaptobrevin family protein [Cryptosporidium serpentis]
MSSKFFVTLNKNLIYSGLGIVGKGVIIFSWYDKILSETKDKIHDVFSDSLNCNLGCNTRTIRQIHDNAKLYIWTPEKSNNIAYAICCISKNYPERLIYAALKEMENFTMSMGSIDNLVILKENELVDYKDFRLNIKELIHRYDNPKNVDKISQMQCAVNEVKDTLQDNIHIILENKGNLESLDNKAALLESEAGAFLNNSVAVKRHFWWKNMKLKLILIGVISLVIGVIVTCLINMFSFSHTRTITTYVHTKEDNNTIKDQFKSSINNKQIFNNTELPLL